MIPALRVPFAALAAGWAGLAIVAAVPARAADLVVAVSDGAGRSLPNAVVMLEPTGGQGCDRWQAPPAVMSQQGVLFHPFVLPVRTGTTVSFPNLDDIRHHVYSFSPARRFELRLYGKDETKTETFDKPGVVALGCNIHDNMLSFILVTTHPVYAVTDADGRARFAGLPAGPWSAFTWHPDQSGERGERPGPVVDLAAGARELELVVELRGAPRTQRSPQEGAYH